MLIDTYIDRVHLSHLPSAICTSSLDPERKESGMDCQIREHLDFKMSNIKKRILPSLGHKLLGNFLATFAVWRIFLATFAIWSNFLFLRKLD